jgi:argininosuccinate lyase
MRSSRFSKGMAADMARLNASISFDQRLYREDIAGSIAWATALETSGVVSVAERDRLIEGLRQVEAEIDAGTFAFSESLEDIHMNVESRLTAIVGEVGAKLHTGRSRNDQVATDFRLWVRERAREIQGDLESLIDALAGVADASIDVVIPAYTHLQRAQPVLLAHHLLAYVEMFSRDHQRFGAAFDQANACPLGSGACAGNQFGIDRDLLRRELEFDRVTRNSLDAVSDRDFACDFLYASSLFLVHLSRFSEDLILWSSTEFGFVVLDDSVTSGSSMLPQKKNPDACELGRAKAGRVIGHLIGLLTVLKGLPLSYNKDLQEDKEGVFDTADTVRLLLSVYVGLVRTMRIARDRAAQALEGGYLEAISVADYLTRRGTPFRRAHSTAGAAVREAEKRGMSLRELSLEDFRALDPSFGEDLFDAISLDGALADKDVVGGTSPRRVREEIARVRAWVEARARSPKAVDLPKAVNIAKAVNHPESGASR